MKALVVGILSFIILFYSVDSKQIAGINLPEYLKSGNDNLVLNGSGVIKKFLFKVYAIGLYVDKKTNIESRLLNEDKPFIIRMHFVRGDISGDKIIEAWNEGFNKATDGNISQIKNEISTFNSCFKNLTIQENDIFQFEYTPNTGTKVSINGKQKGLIGGFNFKKALLGIWLGTKPRDEGVKKELLGK